MEKKAYQRFLILSTPRSGTHMLRTSLNMHRAIVAKTEMFNPDWTRAELFDENTSEHTILEDYIFCDYPPDIAAVGFILHRSGARFGNWPGLWQLLENDIELRVISLRRDNLLQRYLSYGAMRDRQKKRPFAAKYFQVEELRAEFERHEQEIAAFDRRFARHPLMRVSYEQLCSDYKATMRRIQTFLGAPFSSIIPGTQRNDPKPLRESIINLDELIDAFAQTRWSWFFEENPQSVGFQAGIEFNLDPVSQTSN